MKGEDKEGRNKILIWIFVWFGPLFFLCPPISARSWVSLAWGMVFCRSLLTLPGLCCGCGSGAEAKGSRNTRSIFLWVESVFVDWKGKYSFVEGSQALGRAEKSNQEYLWEPQVLGVCLTQHRMYLWRIRITEATQKAVCHYLPIPIFLLSQILQTSLLSARGGSGEL